MALEFPLRRILVTNDDGIDAPGLRIAEQVAATLAEEVWVVAPRLDQSGVAQCLTLHQPLRQEWHGSPRRLSLTGTPADCVMWALAELFAEEAPDLVLSGVNSGANLSDEVMYSGTVGAVLTAATFGVPAVALSQAFEERDRIDWTPAAALSADLIRQVLARSVPQHCWSINFPHLPPEQIRGVRYVRQVPGLLPRPALVAATDGRQLPLHWLRIVRHFEGVRHPESDVQALQEGQVSVMPLHTVRSDDALFRQLQQDAGAALTLPR